MGNSYIGRPGASQGVLEKTEFALGDRVIHKGFGRGKIVGINEKSLTYEVDFEQLEGTRRILFRAKMTRADQEQSGNLE